jgi:hypothetical protein
MVLVRSNGWGERDFIPAVWTSKETARREPRCCVVCCGGWGVGQEVAARSCGHRRHKLSGTERHGAISSAALCDEEVSRGISSPPGPYHAVVVSCLDWHRLVWALNLKNTSFQHCQWKKNSKQIKKTAPSISYTHYLCMHTTDVHPYYRV